MDETGIIVVLLILCLVLTSLGLGLGLGVLLMLRRQNLPTQGGTTTPVGTTKLGRTNASQRVISLLEEIKRNQTAQGWGASGFAVMAIVVSFVAIGIATENLWVLSVSQWLLPIAIAYNLGIALYFGYRLLRRRLSR